MGGIRGFLYTFHMPLFVWCSGYLFAYTNQTGRKSFREYFSQRSTRLLIPYFVFLLIGLIPKIVAAPVLNDTLELDAVQLIRAFFVPREGVWGHFWFLPMIYFIGILGFVIDKLCRKCAKVWIVVTITSMVLSLVSLYKTDILEWFSINDILHFFPYYCLGVLTCYIKSDYIGSHLKTNILIGLVAAFVLFSIFEEVGLIGFVRDTGIAVCMILSVVSLCRSFGNRCDINQNAKLAQTYQIFILSWPCQLVAGIVLERILHVNWLLFCVVVFTTGVILPLILLRVKDIIENKYNTKLISFILGQ